MDSVGIIQGSRLLPLSDSSISKGFRALPNLCIQWQAFWKSQNNGGIKNLSGCRALGEDGWRGRRRWQWNSYSVMAGDCCLFIQLCPTLLWPHGQYVACQDPLSMGFPRQEFWSELSFLSPGDLPHPGMKLVSPALTDGVFNLEPPGKSQITAGACHYTLDKTHKMCDTKREP